MSAVRTGSAARKAKDGSGPANAKASSTAGPQPDLDSTTNKKLTGGKARTSSAGAVRTSSASGQGGQRSSTSSGALAQPQGPTTATTSTTRRSVIETDPKKLEEMAIRQYMVKTADPLPENSLFAQLASKARPAGGDTSKTPSLPSINANGTSANAPTLNKKKNVVDLNQNFVTTFSGGTNSNSVSKTNSGVSNNNSFGKNFHPTLQNNSYHVDQHKHRLQTLSNTNNGGNNALRNSGSRSPSPTTELAPLSSGPFSSPFSLSLEGTRVQNSGLTDPESPKKLSSTYASGTHSSKGPNSKDNGSGPQSMTPPAKYTLSDTANDSDNPFFDKSGPIANLIERRKTSATAKRANGQTKLNWLLDEDEAAEAGVLTITTRGTAAATKPKPPTEPRKRRASYDVRNTNGQVGLLAQSRTLTPPLVASTTYQQPPHLGVPANIPHRNQSLSSPQPQGATFGLTVTNGLNNASSIGGGSNTNTNNAGVLSPGTTPISGGNNNGKYTMSVYGASTTSGGGGSGSGELTITGGGFGTTNQRQVGGAVGADGRFYSHVVLDKNSDPTAQMLPSFTPPLEMAGVRYGANNANPNATSLRNSVVQMAASGRSPSLGPALSSGSVAPISGVGLSQSASGGGAGAVSFSAAALAASTATTIMSPQSRRRTSLFPDKFLKLTDARFSNVVLIPMTYGEGAQNFFASTALSRQRRTAKGPGHHQGRDGSGSSQLPIIYSVRQLQHQRLIHLGLDVPSTIGGKPKYAPTGSYLNPEDAILSAAATSALEMQSLQQRLGMYRAMQQQGQTLSLAQIADLQSVKKKLGASASGGSGNSPAVSPSRGSASIGGASAAMTSGATSNGMSGLLSGVSRELRQAVLANYDGAATISADVLNSILNPLARNSLMGVAINIVDCGDADVIQEEESKVMSSHSPLSASDDALNTTAPALNATLTFCVDEDEDGTSSPLIGTQRRQSANDEVAMAIIIDKINDNNNPSVSEGSVNDNTVNSLSTVRTFQKIVSSKSLNATTTNLNASQTIDNLFQRAVAGKTPRPSPGEDTSVPNPNNNDAGPSITSPPNGGGTLNIAQRKAAQSSNSAAIQMIFSENKSVAEAFKAAQQAAQAAVAANIALPNVLTRGIVKDYVPKEFNWAKKAQEKRKRVAVLIGISKYEDRRIPTRDQCVEDVEALSAILKNIGFKVTVLSTNATNEAGERDPELYPTKENILKAIAEATKICKNEECMGLVCAFGGGYIGPLQSGGVVATVGAPSKNDEHAARRLSLAAQHAGLSGNTSAVLVPPDVYLSQLNAANTITLPDLEIGGSDKGPKNVVYLDTFSILGLKPCDGKYGGFCQCGGRKAVGSEIVAFYSEQQALLMAYYLKRGFTGYATRDSRITVNGLNSYLTRKLKKYDVLSIQSTASTFYIGDLDLARVHELRYCRHEINEIKAEQFAHFAKVHMMVIPTRNQDPSTVEFIRSIQKRFQRAMKNPNNNAAAAMVCYSRLYRQRFHFFMRSVLPEKIYLNDASFIAHESKALLQFKQSLADQNLTYQLLCYHSNLAGCLHIKNPVSCREFISQFDNSDTIRKIKRLKREAEEEKAQQFQAGRVHHLQRASKISAQAQLTHLMARGGSGYLADTFATKFQVDGMAVHQIGIEMILTFITSEYIAQKMDKLVRVGALRQDLITSALVVRPLDEKALHVEKIVTKAQAIVRGYHTRKVFGRIIPLVKSEQAARQKLIDEQQREILALQRNTFASHSGTLELVEAKQRDGWLEIYHDDRLFFMQEYSDSYSRAARKDKLRLIRYAENEDSMWRDWFDFRVGFTAFAFSLMSTMYGMVRVQAKHDRAYNVILHEEDQARRLLQAMWRRIQAGF